MNKSYDDAVKSNFEFTHDNAQQAMNKAAREGKPLVMVFGGSQLPHTQQLLEGGVASMKQKDAVYMYVDVDKVDPNSQLGQLAASKVKPYNIAYTMVAGVSPDGSGKPVLDSPSLITPGMLGDTVNSVHQYIDYAGNNMRGRKFNVPEDSITPKPPDQLTPKPSDQTPKPADQTPKPGQTPQDKVDPAKPTDQNKPPQPGSDAQPKPKEKTEADYAAASKRLNDQAMAIVDTINQMPNAPTLADKENVFRRAMSLADRVSPQDIQMEKERISKEVEALKQKPDSEKAKQLELDKARLSYAENARWYTRAMCGIACSKWGYPEIGAQWVQEAAKRNPQIYDNPGFKNALTRANMPQYLVDKLVENRPRIETPKPEVKPEVPPKPQPEVKPEVPPPPQPEVKPQEPAPLNLPPGSVEPMDIVPTNPGDIEVVPPPPEPQGEMKPPSAPPQVTPSVKPEFPQADKPKLPPPPLVEPGQLNLPPGSVEPLDVTPPTETPRIVDPNVKPASVDQKKPGPARPEQPKQPDLLRDVLPQLDIPSANDKGEGWKFTEQDYEAALKTALDTGKPVVLKIGTKGCHGCDVMDKEAIPQNEAYLQQNAVFVKIDGLKADKLCEKLGAEAWPVNIVGSVRKGADGKPEFVPIARKDFMKPDEYQAFLKGALPFARSQMKANTTQPQPDQPFIRR